MAPSPPVKPPVTPPVGGAHGRREMAESFGADAEGYDRTRPRYPVALIDDIAARLPGPALLDVGIGTGIAAEPFVDRSFAVLGIEPDARMARVAQAKGLEVEIGLFEEWDAAGRSFDGVIAGQTWHWVDPVAGAAKAASVLRPGGILALFWNAGRPAPELEAEFAATFASLDTGLPFNPWSPVRRDDPYGAIIDAAVEGLRVTGAFGEALRLAFPWQVTVDRDVWLQQTATSGGINRLPAASLDALLHGMGAAIDARGGAVAVEYTTVAAVAERLPDQGAPAGRSVR